MGGWTPEKAAKWDNYNPNATATVSVWSPEKAAKWDAYDPYTSSVSKGDSWGALGLKSMLKAAISPLDIPKAIGAGIDYLSTNPAGIIENPLEPSTSAPTNISKYIPGTADIRGAVNKHTGVDLEPHPSTPAQEIFANTVEGAAALAPWGFAGKANLAQKGLNALNLGKTGAKIGALSGVLQQGGVNPLVADIGASIAEPTLAPKNLLSAFAKPKEALAKIPLGIMGLGKKGLNIEAAQAAKDLGIELPAAALTNSTLTGLADQMLGKTFFYGNKLKQKYAQAENQTVKALEDIYDRTGPRRTEEVEKQIGDLFNKSEITLPKTATTKPSNLKQALDDIKINTAILSPDQKSLLSALETLKNEIEPLSKIQTQYGSIKLPLQEMSVDKLIGTKRSLNQIIKWDMDEGVKNQLRKVQKAILRDIEEYGKTNPEWYKTFKEADNLFGKVAKREKLEGLLGDKSVNADTGNLSFNKLAKSISTPGKLDLLKKQVDPETLEQIQKLGKVAQAMAIKSKSVPNPSGTAVTAATLGLVGAIYANPMLAFTGSGIAAVVGAATASKLLTDKKLIDLALKLAKNPDKPNLLAAANLNKRVKELTGYSAVALNKEIQRAESEKTEERDQ